MHDEIPQVRCYSSEPTSKRQVRNISTMVDPFLLTKLPLEGVVLDGVVRVGRDSAFGFVRDHPFPEGTRVLITYDAWLFAVRIEPGSAVQNEAVPSGATAPLGVPAEGESPPESDDVLPEV